MASDRNVTHTLLAITSGAALATALLLLFPSIISRRTSHGDSRTSASGIGSRSSKSHAPAISQSLAETVGQTPLTLLPTLSRLTSCSIYAKLELLNPGGSPKDRVARSIIQSFQQQSPPSPSQSSSQPPLHQGDTIYEGTVGSTGISLATLARSLGVRCHIIMPSDQSVEKSDLLRKLGASVSRVAPAPIVEQRHFVNLARRLAVEHTRLFEAGEKGERVVFADEGKGEGVTINVQGRGWFANQFETDANWRAHYATTGPEIWEQMDRVIDAFVAGAGTGGTVSGVGMYLKDKAGDDEVKVVLADPQGSGLYNKVKNGVFWSEYEREGTRRRSQVDTVIEGIGLVRSTRNWEVGCEKGVVDDAVKVTDEQARKMARWLCRREGWFVGGSSAVNCVAALRTALEMGPGHRIVTIFCDSGMRHLSKFWKDIDAADEEGGDEASMAELEEILAGIKPAG